MTVTAQAPGGATAALQQAAEALRASARRHKVAADHHRDDARRDMQALERLEQACREAGIRLVIHPSGHSSRSTDR